MSRHDDIAARALDDLVDELQHGVPGGAGGDDVVRQLHAVPDELADVADMLQADAAATGHVPRDPAALRRRVLDEAAAYDRRHRHARLPRKARAFGRVGVARRVVVPTICALCAFGGATAIAHTDSGAGQLVRTAARTLNLPAPADPGVATPPSHGNEAAGTGRGDDGPAGVPPAAGSTDGVGDGRGDAGVDGMPPEAPGPNGGMQPPVDANGNPIGGPGPGPDGPAGGGQPQGQQPPPQGQQPQPGGQQPAPGGQQPAPGGQQPAPGGQQPAPGGQQPQQPAPGGQQPAPQQPVQPKPQQPQGQQPPPQQPAGQQPPPQ